MRFQNEWFPPIVPRVQPLDNGSMATVTGPFRSDSWKSAATPGADRVVSHAQGSCPDAYLQVIRGHRFGLMGKPDRQEPVSRPGREARTALKDGSALSGIFGISDWS